MGNRVWAASFTPGDLVVFQAGDGSGPIDGGVASGCSLLEFNPTQLNQTAPVQTIAMPGIDSGTQHALTTAGQLNEHLMSLSADGRYLSVIGYDVAAGRPFIDADSNPQAAYLSPNRTIARIDALGNVDTSTAGAFGAGGTAVHGTASVDGSGFWFSAATPSANSILPTVGYVAFGGSTPATVSFNYSSRALNIDHGQLFASSAQTNLLGIATIGIGLATAGSQPIAPLASTNDLNVESGPCGFYLATVKPGDTSADVLYVANYTSNGFINKYSLVNGNWNYSGHIPAPFASGLTGIVNNGNVTLYTTFKASGNAVLATVTDTAGYKAAPSSTTLATLASFYAGTNTFAFRGVALAPTSSQSIASSTWNSYTGGSWNTPGNWLGGIPDAAGASATFATSSNAQQFITLDTPQTVGTITFASPGSYILQGAGPLTLANGSSPANLTVSSGSHQITAPISGSSSVTVITAQDSASSLPSLTLSPNLSLAGSLVKTGVGTLAFANSNAGIIRLNIPNLTITAGTVVINSGSSSVNRTLLRVDTLALAGKLDLGSNDLLLSNSSLSNITAFVLAARQNGAGGISSTAANSDSTHATTLGVIQNSADGSSSGTALYAAFDNAPANASNVLVKFTYYGDTNLDGQIDGSDYSRLDNGNLNALTGWFNGDFNYDGVIDGSDYTLIDNAFNSQTASLADHIAGSVNAIASIGSATSQVPEPANAAIPALAAISLLVRRRAARC